MLYIKICTIVRSVKSDWKVQILWVTALWQRFDSSLATSACLIAYTRLTSLALINVRLWSELSGIELISSWNLNYKIKKCEFYHKFNYITSSYFIWQFPRHSRSFWRRTGMGIPHVRQIPTKCHSAARTYVSHVTIQLL